MRGGSIREREKGPQPKPRLLYGIVKGLELSLLRPANAIACSGCPEPTNEGGGFPVRVLDPLNSFGLSGPRASQGSGASGAARQRRDVSG